MSEKRFKCPLAVHIFLKQDDKYLFQLRKDAVFNGKWGLVSGHLDGGETTIDACVREAEEEVGIKIKPEDLEFATVGHSFFEGVEYMQFFFWCDTWTGEIENKEPDMCEKLEWFSMDQLPENIVGYMPEAIKQANSGNSFYEYAFD